LFALAQPQIDYGRQALYYPLLLLAGMAAANAIVRIEKHGPSRPRLAALFLATLTALLTHYFCVGAIAALAAYALLRLRGDTRRRAVTVLLATCVVFAIIWAPSMWRQRGYLSSQEALTQFTHNTAAHPVLETFRQALLVPSRLLVEPRQSTVVASMAMAVLYVLPFALLRRRPDMLFWGLWLGGVVAPIMVLDSVRTTNHLWFVRYTLLAGPAVYVLIPLSLAAVARQAWMRNLVPAAAAVTCALAVPDVYHPWQTDPQAIVTEMGSQMGPEDVVIFYGRDRLKWQAEAQYLLLDRYQRPIPCPIALLDQPAAGGVLDRIRRSRFVFVFAVSDIDPGVLPDLRLVTARMYLGRGLCYQFAAGAGSDQR